MQYSLCLGIPITSHVTRDARAQILLQILHELFSGTKHIIATTYMMCVIRRDHLAQVCPYNLNVCVAHP